MSEAGVVTTSTAGSRVICSVCGKWDSRLKLKRINAAIMEWRCVKDYDKPGPAPALEIDGNLPDIDKLPKHCKSCGNPLGEHAYAAEGLSGIYCSSACLNVAYRD